MYILQCTADTTGGWYRVLFGGDFTIAGQPFRADNDENTLAIGRAPEGGFKRRDQRHGKMMQSMMVEGIVYPGMMVMNKNKKLMVQLTTFIDKTKQ